MPMEKKYFKLYNSIKTLGKIFHYHSYSHMFLFNIVFYCNFKLTYRQFMGDNSSI